MTKGPSIALNVIAEVNEFASTCGRILVFLDSNHIHDHFFYELVFTWH